MKSVCAGFLVSAAMSLAVQAAPAFAAGAKWYPFKMEDASSDQAKAIEYSPLEKAYKRYKICVLFPHMKDSFWVAIGYGVAEQAKL